jgi:hypothetical protein
LGAIDTSAELKRQNESAKRILAGLVAKNLAGQWREFIWKIK